jgi:hypothetical protein
MRDIRALTAAVRASYEAKNPEREQIADWLYENHIFIVATSAQDIAARFGGDPELAYAGGILHDIADSVMSRKKERHEEVSRELARGMMGQAGFSSDEVDVVVEDALKYHSCRDGERPKTDVGRAVAAGDAVAHLTTDFYFHLAKEFGPRDGAEAVAKWVLWKIDRDLNDKIAYPEVKKEVLPSYENIKMSFSQ